MLGFSVKTVSCDKHAYFAENIKEIQIKTFWNSKNSQPGIEQVFTTKSHNYSPQMSLTTLYCLREMRG